MSEPTTTEEIKPDLTKERLEKCLPLASAFMSRITTAGFLPDAYATKEEMIDACEPIAKDLLQLFLDSNIKLDQVGFVYQLALASLNFVNERVVASLQEGLEIANTKLWTKDRTEITTQDLEAVLKK